ncbi:MAG: CRISPR-associated endoribonuclease Cas6 [Bacteroidota bacterium]
MRVKLHLSPNYQPVPFNHLHQLTGALHKWLGINDLHDKMSLYSIGWLRGGERIGNGLNFPNGATVNISFWDSSLGIQMAKGILENQEWAYGMKVTQAIEEPIPDFGLFGVFRVDGMVVVRERRADGSREYLKWDDPRANEKLTQLFKKKLMTAGFEGEHLESEMRFAPVIKKIRGHKITIKGTEHKGYRCPIAVQGSPEALRFAWLTGAGELTGSGFGALE